MEDDERLTAKQFQDAGGVEDWRVLAVGASAWFVAPTHAAGAALVRRVADLTGGTDPLPDLDLRPGGVQVRIGASGSAGFTTADVASARAISAAARDVGLAADPSALQSMQLAIDALDGSAVMPFWRTALGYEQRGDDDLLDPMRRDPAIWFQRQDSPRPLRNRIHVDIVLPRADARESVRSAIEADGHAATTGENAVRLADAEGNEVDIVPRASVDHLTERSEVADWSVLFGLMTFYPTASARQAVDLAAAVATLADDAGLPLLVDLRADGVYVDTGKDLWEDGQFDTLAPRIQAVARDLALTADPSRLRFVQIGIDAVDIPAVRGFWRAVLGYEYDPRTRLTDIYDPRRLAPPLFFQQMTESETARREQRNRIHIDLFVPDDQARARIDTALAAGGRIVYDADAPQWWTLADPEGNEVDIAVSVGREELWQAGPA